MLHQQREAADQLFRLKFQLKMGQTTGLKKMRELRKDLARIKTIARERELGITANAVGNAATGAVPAQTAEPRKAAPVKHAAKKAASHPAKKKAAGKKKSSAAPKKKTVAKKKSKAKR